MVDRLECSFAHSNESLDVVSTLTFDLTIRDLDYDVLRTHPEMDPLFRT